MVESENKSARGREKGVVESESKSESEGGRVVVNVLKSEIRVWNFRESMIYIARYLRFFNFIQY